MYANSSRFGFAACISLTYGVTVRDCDSTTSKCCTRFSASTSVRDRTLSRCSAAHGRTNPADVGCPSESDDADAVAAENASATTAATTATTVVPHLRLRHAHISQAR